MFFVRVRTTARHGAQYRDVMSTNGIRMGVALVITCVLVGAFLALGIVTVIVASKWAVNEESLSSFLRMLGLWFLSFTFLNGWSFALRKGNS